MGEGDPSLALRDDTLSLWCGKEGKKWISIWNEYKDHGGKLQTWIGQPDGYNEVTVEEQITACAKSGGVAIPYVMKAFRRKDGLCVGVDNPEQLIENARLVRELT